MAEVIDWITGQNLYGFVVEKHEIPRSGGRAYLPLRSGATVKAVPHTTEGMSIAGAITTMADRTPGHVGTFPDPAHVVLGENRIVQLRPFNMQAAALHDNPPHNPSDITIQFEMVEHSQTDLWLPIDSTLKPTVAFIAWLSQALGIPLSRPDGFLDDMSDCPLPWTRSNPENARRVKLAPMWDSVAGFVGHLEVPWQQFTEHWDPGKLNYTALFAAAQSLIQGENPSDDSATN